MVRVGWWEGHRTHFQKETVKCKLFTNQSSESWTGIGTTRITSKTRVLQCGTVSSDSQGLEPLSPSFTNITFLGKMAKPLSLLQNYFPWQEGKTPLTFLTLCSLAIWRNPSHFSNITFFGKMAYPPLTSTPISCLSFPVQQ